ncbi:hypothetical protein [Myxococcus landrumensis]|uniref:Uncharacterized protein n=1 Tax=Myxococcus landrumensis TaxID=2813577 RepID=A0ABX7ND94_9BACT|nr:hypothetical protein [Myxococcus landrumus]QSQ16363.1 hypothetical protein JY572_10080 [Myxococcus landrumus]
MFHLLAGILAAAGVAGSQPVTDYVEGEAADAELARKCTTLRAPGGKTAHVCRTWHATGGGYYRGTWDTGRYSAGSFLLGNADGHTYRLPWSGGYSGAKRFVIRLCNSTTGKCTAWW